MWIIWTVRDQTVGGLQDLLNKSTNTKDVSSTLPGWESFDPANTTADPSYLATWKGVFCYIACNATATTEIGVRVYDVRVVSL